MLDSDSDDETHLSNHIRSILTDYVITHISIDHVQYSIELAFEIIRKYMHPVSSCEANQVGPLNDLFELIKTKVGSPAIHPILGESLEQGTEVQQLLKAVFKTEKELKSQNVWIEDPNDDCFYSPDCLMSPSLTRFSREKTPKFGCFLQKDCSSSTIATFSPVRDEEYHAVQVDKLENCMDIKLDIDPSVLDLLLENHRFTELISRESRGDSISKGARAFLRSSYPPYTEKLRPISPPLFPRKSDPTTFERGDIEEMVKEARLELVDIKEEEIDQSNERMMLIDGWTTLATSDLHSSTPSLAPDDSGLDELDDLSMWQPTSPMGEDSAKETLHDIQMDVPIFSRLNYSGKGEEEYESHKSDVIYRDSTAIISSRPYPPSGSNRDDNCGKLAKTPMILDYVDPILDDNTLCGEDIQYLFSGLKGANSSRHSIIMNEHLDEEENMFLKVPILPSASSFSKACPENPISVSLSQFLLGSNADIGNKRTAILKEVVGLKSLNSELSWRPFSFGSKLPTHIGLLKVDTLPFDDDIEFDAQHEKALDFDTINPTADEHTSLPILQMRFLTDPHPQTITIDFSSLIDLGTKMIALTRSERKQNISQLRSSVQPSDYREGSVTYYPCGMSDNSPDVAYIPDPQHSSIGPAIEALDTYRFSNDLVSTSTRAGFYDELSALEDDPATQWNYETSRSTFSLAANNDVNSSVYSFQNFDYSNAIDTAYLADWDILREDDNVNALYKVALNQHIPQEISDAPSLPIRLTIKDLLIDQTSVSLQGENVDGEEVYVSRNQSSNLILNVQSNSNVKNISGFPLFSERQSLSAYLQLRGKSSATRNSVQEDQRQLNGGESSLTPEPMQETDQYHAKEDLLKETRALVVPSPWLLPETECTYLISMSLYQQRALVRYIESSHCHVRLIVRESLSFTQNTREKEPVTPQLYTASISVIVNPFSGVVLFPLPALASGLSYSTLIQGLSSHSYRYSRILLVLLAFPSFCLMKPSSRENRLHEGACAYSPAALKATRRIRRDLALREGTNEMQANCKIELAFANNVEELALCIRFFGDMVHQDSPVDYAPYLGDEEQEGEDDLARVEGMNPFCAAVILSCCTFDEFLSMTPEMRLRSFTDLIGRERTDKINYVISTRMESMDITYTENSI